MITIGNHSIRIKPIPPPENLPTGQKDAYQLLLELSNGTYQLKDIITRLRLASPLPLWARLHHLESKGAIDLSILN